MQAFHQRGIHHYIADRPLIAHQQDGFRRRQIYRLTASAIPECFRHPHPQGITYFLSKVIPPSVELPYFIKFLAWGTLHGCIVHHPNLITAIINILCRPIETERNKKSSIENENHSFFIYKTHLRLRDCTTAL